MNVEEKVKDIVATHIGIPVNEVQLSSYLQDDLNSDPLTMADLVVSLEDEFKVEIPSEESMKFEKVEDIVNFIADKIGEV
jgi:acyl carrier protein